MLLIGVAAWRFFVYRALARAEPHLAGADRGAARFGAATLGVLLLAWALALVVQLVGFRDPFVPLREDLSFLIAETFWGTVWLGQGGVLLLLLLPALALATSRRGAERVAGTALPAAPGPAWVAVALGAVLLGLTLSLSSHAMSVEGSRTVAVLADLGHTLAAGAWIGSLAVILTLTRPSDASALGGLAAQLRAFSPVAIVAVPVLVLLGLVLAWHHLSAPADLWASPYGRILSAKIAVAGLVMLAGLLNWRRGMPGIEDPSTQAAVRRRAGWEVAAALVVVILTGLLTSTPKPVGGF